MADPRTNADIAAAKQAADIAQIESVRTALPPGFQIVPDAEMGGFLVQDPAGEFVTHLTPGQVTQDVFEQAVGAAQHMAETTDYSHLMRVGDGTRTNPVVVQQPSDIHAAGQLTNTEATEGQKAEKSQMVREIGWLMTITESFFRYRLIPIFALGRVVI